MNIDILKSQVSQPFSIPEDAQKLILKWATDLPEEAMIGRFTFLFQSCGLSDRVQVTDLATNKKLEIVIPDDPDLPICSSRR